MGALCCCPCEFVDENEEYPLPTSPNPFYRLRFFFSGTGFQRLDGRSASSPIHAATTALTSSGITPTHTQQPYSRPQRDGLVSRRDKSITSLLQQRGFGKQREGADDKASSTEKALPTKVAYVQPSSQDEDVCPTCLDEYTPENPKITTRCSHHFHLGCIYEWLERSDSCPICGKEMEFCESP